MKNKAQKKRGGSPKKRFTFRRIFYNNRFVLALSVILAFLLWVVLAINDTEHYPKRISNVPISVVLSDEAQQKGLAVFSPAKTETADVSVKGNTLVVNQITNSDLEVVPENVSQINAPGKYEVKLVGKNIGNLSSNFEFAEIKPAKVTLYVDSAAEKSMPITFPASMDKIDTANYYSPGPAANVDSVTVSGPKTQVDTIDHLGIEYTAGSAVLTATKTFETNVVAYDADGRKLDLSNMVTLNPSKVTVSIQVQPKKTVTVKPTFTNMPDSINLESGGAFTVTPPSIQIAGPKETLDKLAEVNLEPIDASQIDAGHNSFNQKISDLPAGCTIISSGNTVAVTLNNMKQYTSQQMTCSQFTLVNIPQGMTASVTNTTVPVTVVGKGADLQGITDSNLTGTVDLSSVTQPGIATVPMTVKVGSRPCWAYGTYQVNVVVAKK